MFNRGLRARVTTGLTALHWAVQTGDIGVLLALVAAGADVNGRTEAKSVIDGDHTPASLCGGVSRRGNG